MAGRYCAERYPDSSARTHAVSEHVSSGFAGVQPKLFRKQRNLWLAYASELGSPILRLAASSRARGPATPTSNWRKGLILSHTHIGDVLYRTCSLPMLREHLPRVQWTYAVSRQSAEVLRNNPHVAEILPIIRGEDSWNLVAGGLDELRSRNFDVALCSNTLRHHPDLALATWLGIPNRVAFSGKGLSGLMNYPVAMGFPDSYPAYFRTMVAALIERPGDWPLRPRVYPSLTDENNAARLFESLGLSRNKAVVACSLGTRQGRGNWPEGVVLSILENARARLDFDIVLTGVQSDSDHLNQIAAASRFPVKVLAGGSGVLTFAAFLKRCTALLTVDSGPRHIGNAVGIPVAFLRNLYQLMKETGAYCDSETDLAPPVDYLDDASTERIARAQPVGLLADKLLERITVSERPA